MDWPGNSQPGPRTGRSPPDPGGRRDPDRVLHRTRQADGGQSAHRQWHHPLRAGRLRSGGQRPRSRVRSAAASAGFLAAVQGDHQDFRALLTEIHGIAMVIRCRAGSAPHPRAQPLRGCRDGSPSAGPARRREQGPPAAPHRGTGHRGCPIGRSPRPDARSGVVAAGQSWVSSPSPTADITM